MFWDEGTSKWFEVIETRKAIESQKSDRHYLESVSWQRIRVLYVQASQYF